MLEGTASVRIAGSGRLPEAGELLIVVPAGVEFELANAGPGSAAPGVLPAGWRPGPHRGTRPVDAAVGGMISPSPAGEPPLARLFAIGYRLLIDQLHDRLRALGWTDVRPAYGFVLLAARDQRPR